MWCYEQNNSNIEDREILKEELKFINKKLLNTENAKFTSVKRFLISIAILIAFSFNKAFENQEIFWLDLMLVGLVALGIGYLLLICLQVSRYKCIENIKTDLLNKLNSLVKEDDK